MKARRLMQIVVFIFSVVFPLAGTGCAQQRTQTQDTTGLKSGDKITVTGQIDRRENMGGFYVKGQMPPTLLFIENQNPKVLEELVKSQKKVTIEGHFTAGADYLFIEKIDGQPYQGQ